MIGVGPWDAAVVIAKTLSYASTLGAAGGCAFLVYCKGLIPPDCGGRIRRGLGALLVIAVAASAAKVLAMSASMAGDASGSFDPTLNLMVLQTGEGNAALARLIGVGLLFAALMMSEPPVIVTLLGSVLSATSFAWVGHVHALGEPWLWTAVLVVHLLGVGFWLGALPPLWLMARGADVSSTAGTAARFGGVAVVTVGLLVVAGVTLLCALLQAPADLRDSSYGRLALGKLVSVALLLALAALNRLRLTPRMRLGDPAAVRAFGRSVMLEIILAFIILSVTAAMSTLTGPGAD